MRALFQIPARDSPTLEKKDKWSPTFHDFLAKCLEKNPKKRGDVSEILQVILFLNFIKKIPLILLLLILLHLASICKRL
jgi:serine/threonine-protein kinase 24/25/MST4